MTRDRQEHLVPSCDPASSIADSAQQSQLQRPAEDHWYHVHRHPEGVYVESIGTTIGLDRSNTPKQDTGPKDLQPPFEENRTGHGTSGGDRHAMEREQRKRRPLQLSFSALNQLRDELLLARAEGANERQKARECVRHARESNEIFMAARKSEAIDSNLAQSLEPLQGKHNQADSDYAAVDDQLNKAAEVERRLSSLEHKLMRKEERFYSALEKILRGDPLAFRKPQLQDNNPGFELEADSVSRDGGMSTEVPSLLERFFDQSGNVMLCRERLVELEDDFQEGMEERNFVQDQDVALEVSDEAFRKDYEARRSFMIEELERTMKNAEQLRRDCLANGLNPEQWRKARQASLSGSDSDASAVPTPMVQGHPLVTIPSPASAHGNTVSADTHTISWLNQMSTGNAAPRSTVESWLQTQPTWYETMWLSRHQNVFSRQEIGNGSAAPYTPHRPTTAPLSLAKPKDVPRRSLTDPEEHLLAYGQSYQPRSSE